MNKDTDINLELRSEILEIALNLEEAVNQLLLALLLIESQNRKAISNKSGSLSFKNKIDLLFDLDILMKNEHDILLLLMEYRNQFLHNINCCSFEDAFKLLGNDKEKKLLKLAVADSAIDKEGRSLDAFRTLNIKCSEIISQKLKDRRNQIENRAKAVVKPVEAQIFFINKYFDLLRKVVSVCENNISEAREVTMLINQLFDILNNDVEALESSEEYTKIQAELKNLNVPGKIKSLLER